MKTVLVTGANGFVGRHLVRELTANGYSIVAVGGSQVKATDNLQGQKYMTLDLTKRDETDRIDFAGISGVIHLAGLAAVGPSFDKPMDYINTNIGIQINLFETALAQKAGPRFLIVSSATIYDPKAELPLGEDASVVPNSPYAVSKIGQEQMAGYYATRGFECITVRPFNHIGPGQNPGFIVPDLAQQIIAAEKGLQNEIKVGNLDAKRDYTDVRDIVRAYRLLTEKGVPGETYNICSGKALSGHYILDGLVKATGYTPTVRQDPVRMRPSDTPEIYGSHQKLTNHTGWQPEIPFEQTMTDVIEDWRSRKA